MRTIYIDMDKVMCDFDALHSVEISDSNPYPQSRPGFFQDLEPIPGSIEAVKSLIADENNEVYILTAPSYMNPHCYMDKRIWIEKYFGLEFCKNLIICYYKNLLIGDVLIDDSQKNGQLKFQGELIQFGSDEFPNWDVVLSHLANTTTRSGLNLEAIDKYVDEVLENDDWFDKQRIQNANNKRWKNKFTSFISTCTDDQVQRYLTWEKKYQDYYYKQKHTQCSSNIFKTILSISQEIVEDDYLQEYNKANMDFLGEAYKILDYTILMYYGQGVYITVNDKFGKQVL